MVFGFSWLVAIQISLDGASRIVPLYDVTRYGVTLSTLVANGWSTSSLCL